jgi:hypothetical protein
MKNGFSYVLSPEIIKHIQKIEVELGITNSHIKSYESNNQKYDKYKQNTINRNKKDDVSWENIRNFKSTVIEKKEGIEKKKNDVRICLNKMSNKNYDIQRDAIFSYILDIENNEEELEKIALSIFDIASTNKFYSEMYAKLYRELIKLYPVFQKVMNDFLQNYLISLQDIKYADPNIDYDLFCEYTKISDKRKATAQFIVHMMHETILSQEYIISIITNLIKKVRENMNLVNKVNEVEEITELVNIFISQSITIIIPNEQWIQCIDAIHEFSKYKLKEKNSLSSRIIFKYSDLVSIINKTEKK